ncbi:hypothetical protein QZH41_002728 [Actinostola sp. cb2023]|nr:hypothetical protein QZH41_002728 [Actinostola sp. cb2023]
MTMAHIFRKEMRKRYYQYSSSNKPRTIHTENGSFYANVKASSAKGYRKDFVPKEEVYELTRYYKTNKANPSFSRLIASVRSATETEPKPWYLVLYKWTGGQKEFIMQRHGNASKPTASAYFRKDPQVSQEIDEYLEQGLAVDTIYSTLSRKACCKTFYEQQLCKCWHGFPESRKIHRTVFNQTDKVVIKSVGVRERTDKSGKVIKYSGNVYFHYLTQCLKEFDQNFAFSSITVPSCTMGFLPEGARERLEAKGLMVEKK